MDEVALLPYVSVCVRVWLCRVYAFSCNVFRTSELMKPDLQSAACAGKIWSVENKKSIFFFRIGWDLRSRVNRVTST